MSLISKYINKIDINTINDFALKNNIFLNEKELNILYDVVKNKYEEVLYKDDSKIKKYLKLNLSDENYDKVTTLFDKYMSKYGNYLLWDIISEINLSLYLFALIISISSLYGG